MVSYEVKSRGQHTVISINGELNLYNVFKFKNELMEYFEKNTQVTSLVFDMREVVALDSSGIAFLAQLERKMQIESQKFALLGVTDNILKTLKIAKLDNHFKMYKSESELD